LILQGVPQLGGRQTTVRWQKQVFIRTLLSCAYLALARLSWLDEGRQVILIVREKVRSTAKNVKSHDFLDFQKNVKKRRSMPIVLKNGDHAQSVMLPRDAL